MFKLYEKINGNGYYLIKEGVCNNLYDIKSLLILFKCPLNNYMTKLVLILCAVNTIAILFLCWNAYMQIDSQGHIWNMFQDFERLLIDILQGRITETESV